MNNSRIGVIQLQNAYRELRQTYAHQQQMLELYQKALLLIMFRDLKQDSVILPPEDLEKLFVEDEKEQEVTLGFEVNHETGDLRLSMTREAQEKNNTTLESIDTATKSQQKERKMSLTRHQQQILEQYVRDMLEDSVKGIVDSIVNTIIDDFSPEGIFDEATLEEWALNNGFVKED